MFRMTAANLGIIELARNHSTRILIPIDVDMMRVARIYILMVGYKYKPIIVFQEDSTTTCTFLEFSVGLLCVRVLGALPIQMETAGDE